MLGSDLRNGRKYKGWTQQVAAAKLRVSQPYLALMENGDRRVPGKLARRAAHLYGLSLSVLPVETDWSEPPQCEDQDVAACLAGLGYPGLAYLRPAKKKNPEEVLFASFNSTKLETPLPHPLPCLVF